MLQEVRSFLINIILLLWYVVLLCYHNFFVDIDFFSCYFCNNLLFKYFYFILRKTTLIRC